MEKKVNNESEYDVFVRKLVGQLCYHFTSHWPIVLSLFEFQSFQTIEYFDQGSLHTQIYSMHILFQSTF